MRSRPGSRGKPMLQPFIAEVLRTCIYPATLVLRVEKIFEERTKKSRPVADPSNDAAGHDGGVSEQNFTYRLYLSDGEHMIQAFIAPHLHPLIKLHETTEGSLIELRDYKIRRAKRLHSKGEVIFLGIQDYVCISLNRPVTSQSHEEILMKGGGFFLEEDETHPATPRNLEARIQVPSSPQPAAMSPEVPASQESDTFETIKVDPETAKKRRQALYEISSNTDQKRKRQFEYHTTPTKRRDDESELISSQDTDLFEVARNDPETVKRKRRALHNIGSASRERQDLNNKNEATPTKPTKHQLDNITPLHNNHTLALQTSLSPANNISSATLLPLHNLDSLLHPAILLPPKNYSVTILAVISWISPAIVSRPPFPPRRSLKLHDPSINSRQVGVSISIFIDAATFKPRHGTVALFQGVVMQRHNDEVILNAYPSLRGSEWYVDDEERLGELRHDVPAMRDWWEERKKARSTRSAG